MSKKLGVALAILSAFATGAVSADLERFTPLGPPLGCIDSLVVQPSGRWLIAASGTGVSASEDRGASWTLSPDLATEPPRAMVHGYFLGDVFAAAAGGLYFSNDGGRTWQYRGPLSLGVDEQNERDLLVFSSGSAAAPGTLYLARGRRLLRSRDGGVHFLEVLVTPTVIRSLDVDPARPAHVFVGIAGTSLVERPLGETFYASTDAGRQWSSLAIHTVATSSFGVERLRFDRSTGALFAISGLTLFRSHDLGRSWQRLTPREGPSAHTYDVFLAQGSPRTVYAVHRAASDFDLLVSRNLGESWRRVGSGEALVNAKALFYRPGLEIVVAEGHGAIIELDLRTGAVRTLRLGEDREFAGCPIDSSTTVHFLPNDPATVFVTSFGALWTSRDRGTSWSRYPDLYSSFLDLATRADRPDEVIAATDEGISLSTDGGRTFYRVGDQPVASLVSWLADGTLLAAGNGVFRSLDEGATLAMTLPDLPDNGQEAEDERWILSLLADPLDPARIYATALDGYGRHFRTYQRPIFRTDDTGVSWMRLPREGSVLAVDPRGGSAQGSRLLLWAESTLEESLDGGEHWTVVSVLDTAAPGCAARDLAADRRGEGLLWAACPDGVRRSVDGGQTFTPVPGSEGLFAFRLVPQEGIRGRIWAVTDRGLRVGRFAL